MQVIWGHPHVFDLSDLSPTSPVKIQMIREGFFFSFFLHLPACNITYNFHLFIKPDSEGNAKYAKLPNYQTSSAWEGMPHLTRREGSNMHKTGLEDFERISRLAVIPSRQIMQLYDNPNCTGLKVICILLCLGRF